MEESSIQYSELSPAGRWRELIECFWQVADRSPRQNRCPEHIVPDGCPELIVHLADPFSRRVAGRWRRQRRAFLAGTLSRPWSLRPGAVIDTFGIRFRPAALPAWLEIDMRTTVDREVPLGELVGEASVRRLTRVLADSADLAARARAAEAWLDDRPRPGAAMNELSRRAVHRIVASRGGERVERVAAAVGISRRQLERIFARDLGIGPKLYARIVRLQAALVEIGDEERSAGVDAALAAGYFDQSHLARDFRGLAGRRAGRARAGDGEMARHFTAPDRLLALLAGE